MARVRGALGVELQVADAVPDELDVAPGRGALRAVQGRAAGAEQPVGGLQGELPSPLFTDILSVSMIGSKITYIKS